MPDLRSEIGLAKKELAALLPAPIRDPPIVLAKQVSAIEFATSPEYLGLALYPLQGTLVKVIAAQPETFTSYDAEVLNELTSGFAIVDDRGRDRYAGSRGLSPDLAKRLELLRESGAPGFREVVMVAGRRFGKSYLAAICSLYRLWQILQLGDPHQTFGIDPDKRLVIPVMSGSFERARRDQFGDLHSLVTRSNFFEPFIVGYTTSKLFMTTAAGLSRSRSGEAPVLIEIAAVETTTLSTRGPAIPISVFDEVAHLIGAGSTADFADLYATTLPATAQFRQYALVWMGSSPSTQEGQFFESYCRGLSVGPDGVPAEPDVLVVQLESWTSYRDWERAHTVPKWPDGPCFPKFTCPILEYNDQLRATELDNPSTFAVEFRAQWSTVLDAYLPAV